MPKGRENSGSWKRKKKEIFIQRKIQTMYLKNPDCARWQAQRNLVFPLVKAFFFLHNRETDCHLTTSFAFLKTNLMLRFLLMLGQPNFHALQWRIMLFSFVRKKMNEWNNEKMTEVLGCFAGTSHIHILATLWASSIWEYTSIVLIEKADPQLTINHTKLCASNW